MLRTITIAAMTFAIAWTVLGESASARMTVLYDVPNSVRALTGVQVDGSSGLAVADGLFQQQPADPVLPVDRQVGKVTGGAGSPITPSIRDLDGPTMVTVIREQVDAAGARMAFIDVGPDPIFGAEAGVNLAAAMTELATTPFPGGGTYADRVHMYVGPFGPISDPVAWAPFWRAMALAGGVWFEAYQGRLQWSAEHWLAWPRLLRDGLVARGMDPARLHLMVRGPGQSEVWSRMRVGAACELLANGPGAYRIEDHQGFVREFRATFGTAPAGPGPSPIACQPAPQLPDATAQRLAGLLELERTGRTVARLAVSPRVARTGRSTSVRVALGTDPLGIASKLGADPAAFWSLARARVTATGPGVAVSAPLGNDGSASVAVEPASVGSIALGLTLDGAAVRAALGPPADLALSLAPYRGTIAPTLDRLIAQPTSWELAIPVLPSVRAELPLPRLTVQVLARRVPPKSSRLALRLSRPATRMLVEVGVVRSGRFVRIKRLRISETRVVVSLKIPRGGAIRARLVPEA